MGLSVTFAYFFHGSVVSLQYTSASFTVFSCTKPEFTYTPHYFRVRLHPETSENIPKPRIPAPEMWDVGWRGLLFINEGKPSRCHRWTAGIPGMHFWKHGASSYIPMCNEIVSTFEYRTSCFGSLWTFVQLCWATVYCQAS